MNLHQECSASIYVVHQVITFHVRLQCRCQRDGTGVIYQNIDATELEKGQIILNFILRPVKNKY